VADELSLDFCNLNRTRGEIRQANHLDTGNPARDDQLEAFEVHAHIECKPMLRDSACLDGRSDRADFPSIRPAPAKSRVMERLDAPVGASADHRFLQKVDILTGPKAMLSEHDDRIDHNLAGTVVCDIPAAVRSS
jgi:hypothetical protein